MTERKRAEVYTYNEASLRELAWKLKVSQGQFSLILAHCNYAELRREVVRQLKVICDLEIREFTLPNSTQKIYTAIQNQLQKGQVPVLMVFGLETVIELDEAFKALNQVREEFRKNFYFPIVLWVTDEVLIKLRQLAPDFWSWTVTTEFSMPTELLIRDFHQRGDEFFTKIAEAGAEPLLANDAIFEASYRQEGRAALRELEVRGQKLGPDLQAYMVFVLGREHYFQDEVEDALQNYKHSLNFWQQHKYLERQGVLLYHIGLCYRRRAQTERNESQRKDNWQEARCVFQQSLDAFEQAGRQDLVAKFITSVEEALLNLEEWTELEAVVQNSLNIHQSSDYQLQLAKNLGFVAEILLYRSDSQGAEQAAKQALEILTNLQSTQQYEKNYYLYLLARAYCQQERILEAIETLEQARKLGIQNVPRLYTSILLLLRDLLFQEKQYQRAFDIKQERLSVEQQYGLRAFVGAGRLQPQQKTEGSLPYLKAKGNVAQEITVSGRQEDIDELIKRIGSTEHILTVLYGQSGVGKSSMLEAGLIPDLLDKHKVIGSRDVLPVLLRKYSNWIKELSKVLETALRKQKKINVVYTEHPTLDSVLDRLQRNSEDNLLTVLVFDQFEEFFFINTNSPNERNLFAGFLSKCLNLTAVKVIISLREDYLHLLLDCNRRANLDVINNNILDKNILYYIGNLSPESAKSVIESLTKHTHFYLESDLVNDLVNALSIQGEVRPIELQIVGTELQEQNITESKQFWLLGTKPKEKLVQSYLGKVVEDCGEENKQIAELVLYLLTEENDKRPPKTLSELETDLRAITASLASDCSLPLVLDIFVKSRLVSLLPEIPSHRYQLVHDYLVSYIRQRQNELMTTLQKEIEKRRKAEAALPTFLLLYKVISSENQNEYLDLVNSILEKNPRDLAARIILGVIYDQKGNRKEALTELNQVIEVDRENFLALLLRYGIYLQQGQHKQAFTDFEKATSTILSPDYPENRNLLPVWAVFYRKQLKTYPKALDYSNQALNYLPDNCFVLCNRGETYRLMQRYDEALSDFNRAIELNPSQAITWGSRGQVYQALGRYEDAIADFNRALDLNPGLNWALRGRGETYCLLERYQEALDDFDRVFGSDSNDVLALIGRGEVYEKLQQLDKALTYFDRAFEIEPSNQQAINARIRVYKQQRRFDKALGAINLVERLGKQDAATRLIASSQKTTGAASAPLNLLQTLLLPVEDKSIGFLNVIPSTPESRENWALDQKKDIYAELVGSGHHEEVLADLNQSIERNPNSRDNIGHRGTIYCLIESYEEALADFNRLLNLNPDDSFALARRGQVYRVLGRYEEAITDLSRGLELDPNLTWAIADRGETYRLLGRNEEALADFNRTLDLNPDDSFALASRGETYRLLQRNEEALTDFNCAIDLYPDYFFALACRGETYRLLGRYEEALADFNRALDRELDYSFALARRGETYRLLGRNEEALADFNRLLNLNPDDSFALASRGQVYRVLGRYEEAITDLSRGLELDPNLTWAIAERGETYRLLGRYEDALADFNRLLDLDRENDWVLYERSLIYQILGRTSESESDLTKATEVVRNCYQEYDGNPKKESDWRNTINFAIYHLAANKPQEGEKLYREALEKGIPQSILDEAIRDLGAFLHLFPNRIDAKSLRDLLQSFSKSANLSD